MRLIHSEIMFRRGKLLNDLIKKKFAVCQSTSFSETSAETGPEGNDEDDVGQDRLGYPLGHRVVHDAGADIKDKIR